jgi:protocatechuate 3,4-dioxygenase beta subunit
MYDDDSQTGRVLSRREVIRLLGAGAASLLTGGARGASPTRSTDGPACVVRPRQIEGPFFVDAAAHRSDIRSDPRTGVARQGVPLRLTFKVSDLNGGRCLPLSGAQVDVWHCDAEGLYSDTEDWQKSTLGQRFLRGYQLTDRKGIAGFTTIFPGWYPNRAVHIHFKIRTQQKEGSGTEFTSQIYFDDELTDELHAQAPYSRRGPRKVRNNRDLIFLFRGSQLVLPLREEKKGYAGTFELALDLS